jgi:pimeloyl-ACP methyl ester carboxylesterase
MRRGENAHADAAEDARVSVIEGAGHACNLERVDEYEAAVRRFIEANQ